MVCYGKCISFFLFHLHRIVTPRAIHMPTIHYLLCYCFYFNFVNVDVYLTEKICYQH